MFNYHMHFEKHYQYLEDETIKGFTSDIYFKNFEDAFNLMKKYEGNKMYNIRISNTITLAFNSNKNKELAGKKIISRGILIELDEGIITDYR